MTGGLLSYTVSYNSAIVTVGRYAGSFIRRNSRYSSCRFSLLSALGFDILLLRIFESCCPASAPTDAGQHFLLFQGSNSLSPFMDFGIMILISCRILSCRLRFARAKYHYAALNVLA